MLIDQDLDEVRAGWNRLMRSRRYKSMPTVAELLDAVEGRREDKAAVAAAEAWARLLEAVAGWSFGDPEPELDDISRRVARTMGGLSALRDTMTNHNMTFKSKEFQELYKRYLETGIPAAEQIMSRPLKELAEGASKRIPRRYESAPQRLQDNTSPLGGGQHTRQ